MHNELSGLGQALFINGYSAGASSAREVTRMAMFKFWQTAAPVKPAGKIQDVLKAGLIIHASATRSGLRIVTFNHTDSFFHYSYGEKSRPTVITSTRQPFTGKGTTVESALMHALVSYTNQNNGSRMGLFNDRVRRTHTTASRLDRWLGSHNGQMWAVMDEDGSIICTLEGHSEAGNTSSAWNSIQGNGPTFAEALAESLRHLAGRP
jgi:hypothetical protein